MAEMAALIYNT